MADKKVLILHAPGTNRDGDLADAILAAGGSITWWESDGTPGDGGWTEHLIGDDFTFSESVYASDLDGADDPIQGLTPYPSWVTLKCPRRYIAKTNDRSDNQNAA